MSSTSARRRRRSCDIRCTAWWCLRTDEMYLASVWACRSVSRRRPAAGGPARSGSLPSRSRPVSVPACRLQSRTRALPRRSSVGQRRPSSLSAGRLNSFNAFGSPSPAVKNTCASTPAGDRSISPAQSCGIGNWATALRFRNSPLSLRPLLKHRPRQHLADSRSLSSARRRLAAIIYELCAARCCVAPSWHRCCRAARSPALARLFTATASI